MSTQGHLSPKSLVWAYCHGIFPMARSGHGPIDWYSPQRRGILPLDTFHVPRNLARRVRRGEFRITLNRAFDRVILACAETGPGRADTWINDEIVVAYTGLHEAGLAHSVEGWSWRKGTEARRHEGTKGGGERRGAPCANDVDDDFDPAPWRLVGGLYGVALWGAFFGESMFSRATDASKVCLVHLVERLRTRGFTLLDTQFVTAHLRQFGVVEVERAEYLRRLNDAVRLKVVF